MSERRRDEFRWTNGVAAFLVGAAVVAVVLGLARCGGDDDDAGRDAVTQSFVPSPASPDIDVEVARYADLDARADDVRAWYAVATWNAVVAWNDAVARADRLERAAREAARDRMGEVDPAPADSGPCGAASSPLPAYVIQRESRGQCDAYNDSGCSGRGCRGYAQIDEGHFAAVSPWNPNVPGRCYGLDYDACVVELWDGGAGCGHWSAC